MRQFVAALATIAALSAACSAGTSVRPSSSTPKAERPTSSPAPPAVKAVAPLHQRTVWLCHPGVAPDPCTSNRAATALLPNGGRSTIPAGPAHEPVDCFYVYPTVSAETSRNSDLRVQPAEVRTAVAQASRFSQVCRVWAPMYRQRPVADLFRLSDNLPNSRANLTAFASLLAAWRDYLRHDNHGRPVVVIGHSQGSAMLVRLLRQEVDPSPTLRRRLLLAILPGANVETRTGSTVGGSFQHLPLCTSRGGTGCVIAYSSFPAPPPAAALFGRPGAGVSYLTGDLTATDRTVACVNPADPGSSAPHLLQPFAPASMVSAYSVPTPWIAFPDQVTAQCRVGGGASWLQIGARPGTPAAGITRERLGSVWGYHQLDVNLALGDLVADVAAAARSVSR